ncbi:sugar ABC transporter substrate-binding protein [Nonomuraea sp. B10E15]|uniref:ABC transporter substrate-binding protein n=1 Tax=unclassified Nonomuraea TaxID=2593643 RepID=UPI00325D2CA6
MEETTGGPAVGPPGGRGGDPTRRGVLKAAAAAAALPILTTACGGTGEGTLTFVYMGDANQQAQFRALFTEFNKVNPNIRLVAQAIPAGNWAVFANTVATRIAGGYVPDIIQVATEGQRIFASKGLLEPLDPYIKADQKIVDDYFADIDPNLIDWNTRYASHDGRTYYMPGGYNTVVLYANTEVFARAGVELPEDGKWTWDEFRAAGERVKAATGAFLVPTDLSYFGGIMPWLATNGASTFDATWRRPTFDSPEAIEAVTFVKGLIDAGLAPKPGGQFDAATALAQGKLATLNGGRWPVIDLRRLGIVGKTLVVSFPTRRTDGSPVGWDGWPITRDSKNKQEAWTFIKFLISKQAATFFASIGGTIVPARRSVAEGPAFTGNASERSERLAEAISYATPIPSPDRGPEAQKIIEEAWLKVLSGNGEPAATLAEANRQLGGLL